jgi:alpha,alpha-trehalase
LDGARKTIDHTGLNRYKSDGVGMPFEVEPGHFDVLALYAVKYNLPVRDSKSNI